jgi:hypothetical protein
VRLPRLIGQSRARAAAETLAWGHGLNEALRAEAGAGYAALVAEGVAGAARFAGGAGRQGRFEE